MSFLGFSAADQLLWIKVEQQPVISKSEHTKNVKNIKF